jgi:hypothetical protein
MARCFSKKSPMDRKQCPLGKVCNEDTGYCKNPPKHAPRKAQSKAQSKADCMEGEIRNPDTGRCVKIGGSVFKKLVKKGLIVGKPSPKSQSPKKPSPKKPSPKSPSPVRRSATGFLDLPLEIIEMIVSSSSLDDLANLYHTNRELRMTVLRELRRRVVHFSDKQILSMFVSSVSADFKRLAKDEIMRRGLTHGIFKSIGVMPSSKLAKFTLGDDVIIVDYRSGEDLFSKTNGEKRRIYIGKSGKVCM